MTDRAALADRLEALAKKATPELHIDSDSTTIIGKRRDGDVARDGFGNVAEMVLDGEEDLATRDIFVDLVNDLPTILAALREPGFTPEQEAAIKRVDAAIFRAVEKVAHQRGAEAMRKAAADLVLQPVEGAVHRFICNGQVCRDESGCDKFMSVDDVNRAFNNKAAAILALPLPEPKQ